MKNGNEVLPRYKFRDLFPRREKKLKLPDAIVAATADAAQAILITNDSRTHLLPIPYFGMDSTVPPNDASRRHDGDEQMAKGVE